MTGKRLKIAAAVLCLLLLFSVLTPAALADDSPAADIVFLLDTTGSMENEMPLVRQEVDTFLSILTAAGIDTRVAIVQFKDITKDGASSTQITRSNSQTWFDPEEALVLLGKITPAGGGSPEPAGTEADYSPDCETPLDAVGCMLNGLSFRPQASKHAVLITDGGCKPDNKYGFAASGGTSVQRVVSQKLAEAGVTISIVTYSSFYRDENVGYQGLFFHAPGKTPFFGGENSIGLVLANMFTDYLDDLIVWLTGEPTNDGYYLFTARLYSKSESMTVNNLEIEMRLADGLTLTGDSFNSPLSFTEEKLTLTNEKPKDYFWKVSATPLPENTNYTCAVTVKMAGSAVGFSQKTITVPGTDVHDYTWDFDKDSYSFANVMEDLHGHGFGEGPYYISQDDFRALKNQLSKVDLESMGHLYGRGGDDRNERIESFLRHEITDWKGSCYGLSLTMALFKVGILDAADYTSSVPPATKSIAPLKASADSSLESMINVYHFTQAMNSGSYSVFKVGDPGFAEKIKAMYDRGKDVGSPGHMPFIINMSYVSSDGKGSGHAVVCYGAEEGEWTYAGATYHRRMLIADPNILIAAMYIYISDDWDFAVYNANNHYDTFVICNEELNVLDALHYSDLAANQNALMLSKYGIPFTVTSEKGSLTITPGGASGNLDFVPDFVANARADGGDESVWPDYILQDGADSYTVTPAGDGNEMDFKLFFSDVALGLTGAAESAEVSRDGSIEVKGAEGQVTVSVTANESELGFVTVSGEAEGNFSLELDEDGSLTVSGGLADYTVSNMTVEPETDEAVIHGGADAKISAPTGEKPDVTVRLDADGDGAFESELDKEHPGHVYEYTDNGDGTHTATCYMGDDSFSERHHFSGLYCRECGAFILSGLGGGSSYGGAPSGGAPSGGAPSGGAWVNPFRDVDESDWFYDAVRYVSENGLMRGVSATVFGPDLSFSRAMLVTVLYRLEGEPKVNAAAPFDDVAAGQWYSDAVAWAAANGVVKGYGDGSFGPEDSVTREQFAAILWRYAGEGDAAKSADLSRYADASAVSDWAREAMGWACATGLITGRTSSELAPGAEASRAEAAAILTRFGKKYL